MSNARAFEVVLARLGQNSKDPLLAELPEEHRADIANVSKSEDTVRTLLRKTGLPNDRIGAQYESKLEHKSLLLEPTSALVDTRAIKAAKEQKRREAKRKPRPMSVREERASGLNIIPREARQYSIYIPLNTLWSGYMNDILSGGGSEAKLLKADYHGAILTVLKSSCPSFVFLTGIVIKETRHTFVICTKQDVIKTIPKRGMVFGFQVELKQAGRLDSTMKWEVYGEHFGYRAAERVGKKFKGKSTVDF